MCRVTSIHCRVVVCTDRPGMSSGMHVLAGHGWRRGLASIGGRRVRQCVYRRQRLAQRRHSIGLGMSRVLRRRTAGMWMVVALGRLARLSLVWIHFGYCGRLLSPRSSGGRWKSGIICAARAPWLGWSAFAESIAEGNWTRWWPVKSLATRSADLSVATTGAAAESWWEMV